MGKVALKLEELSERERRQLWRDDPRIHLLASEPTSMHLFSKPHRRRAKKAGRRRKTSQLPDVLSPSKIKKIKLAHENSGTNIRNSGGLE
jgi:hypothetical protein